MRTKFNTKILLRFAPTKTCGFTLIELLVVIVMGGILAAIAVPTLLSRVSAAKQAEAQVALSSLNRAQQAYFLQNSKFADNLTELDVAVSSNNYDYAIRLSADEYSYATQYATARAKNVRSYTSMAAIVQDQLGNLEVRTVICEANQPGLSEASPPVRNVDSVQCAPETRGLK